MENIALPKKVDFLAGKTENEGVVVVEPLYPGYGMTLGNSLRRVLLSSLPGAAVVGVKIKGASHEFMTLPGIQEDVLEIMLNIKQLHIKMYGDEEVRLELKVKGKQLVTAANITKNSQVEIKNPELLIASLTEEKASLEAEIFVRPGRGYRLSEGTKKENNELGYMEIDSIFSPVLAVSLDVENTRVGKMTNWDKLLITLKTDGTISPREAFNQAAQILVDQFSALLPSAQKPAPEIESKEESVDLETKEVAEVDADEADKPAKKKSKK
ncbi:MAG TPA: DNA-directed RNA polymerase subunit alpha [bacterium]|jgi:DNA-directed RNA polymerase subunit alpha|nr:MAG: DNA-directed RNA polymerase subunit alpha [Parcubacteria group bacterium ADurb.Bin115]HNU81152.1 DNA-directed RNA polymerase subunit alpha [bacterium]HPW05345.1 DNA-directed RNA polymerase subunit alpha [bacterium]HPY99552.1 DNA-directed RNA polymerase subunit alpha [bacterium]HQB76031.1 DNA-directed RNA polymerase subunit alpha [bacterium]